MVKSFDEVLKTDLDKFRRNHFWFHSQTCEKSWVLTEFIDDFQTNNFVKYPWSNISNPSCFSKSKQRVISFRVYCIDISTFSQEKGLIKETLILSSAWNFAHLQRTEHNLLEQINFLPFILDEKQRKLK